MSVLCLGEALVDLICHRPARGLADADAFVPHFGGATANVAVAAARQGAEVALAGGARDDAWGRWLRDGLERAGVDTRWFALRSGGETTVAFTTIDDGGDATYAFYGDSLGAAVAAAAPRLEEAVEASEALFFGGNTLVHEDERAATLRARDRAVELGKPFCFDPNLRLDRWDSRKEALELSRACVEGAFLVKANRAEATLLTGETQARRAGAALAEMGPKLAVVTLGSDGALVAGEQSFTVPGRKATVVSTVGAGDAFMGVLLAYLQRAGWDPDLEHAVDVAVEVAARVTEAWGAGG